jgi:hypothetical protein
LIACNSGAACLALGAGNAQEVQARTSSDSSQLAMA